MIKFPRSIFHITSPSVDHMAFSLLFQIGSPGISPSIVLVFSTWFISVSLSISPVFLAVSPLVYPSNSPSFPLKGSL
jgi:hypothetical protein